LYPAVTSFQRPVSSFPLNVGLVKLEV